MIITEFNQNHMEEAIQIALNNYEEERKKVPTLPKVDRLPDLTHFAENGLGVAAFDEGRMLGFLCAFYPIEDAFGTTNVRGTFSPIQAHGVIIPNNTNPAIEVLPYSRDRIYSLLYQAAADKWVKVGIGSHAIAFYTHDREAVNSFFYNGFGLRCIDAIRTLEDIPKPVDTSRASDAVLDYCEVPRKEWGFLLDFNNELITHLGNSPTFMNYNPIDEPELYSRASEDVRYIAAKADGQYIAYIKISNEGENFVTEDKSMINICGAYCSPAYRGVGVYHNLLCYLMMILKNEGYTLLGVDFESINPTARGFWIKYFTEYTHSLVRRIDDKAVNRIK